MESQAEWTQWIPPYDPRLTDGKIVTQDEHERLIESADCGTSCPGCGICCGGYRDRVTPDWAGTEEPDENHELVRGGLVPLGGGAFYRACTCGEDCPGYGRCCQPFELRAGPETVADARRILLDEDVAPRWQMQQALLTLAHAGSDEAVDVLDAYMPRAHTRLAGFAECAMEEGRYMASVPRNAEEARVIWYSRRNTPPARCPACGSQSINVVLESRDCLGCPLLAAIPLATALALFALIQLI